MSEKSDAANDHLRQLVSELALCLHRLLGSCFHDGHHYVGLTNKLGSANLAHASQKSGSNTSSGLEFSGLAAEKTATDNDAMKALQRGFAYTASKTPSMEVLQQYGTVYRMRRAQEVFCVRRS